MFGLHWTWIERVYMLGSSWRWSGLGGSMHFSSAKILGHDPIGISVQ